MLLVGAADVKALRKADVVLGDELVAWKRLARRVGRRRR
jgi:hypothetical protein